MTRVVAWERRYGRKLLATDALIIVSSVALAQFLRFGVSAETLSIPFSDRSQFTLAYTALSALVAVVWLVALALGGSREPIVYGTGATEYKRVVNTTLFAFGLLAIAAFAWKVPIGRGYLMYALPIGLFLLLFSRWLWRKRLQRQRKRGKNSYRTLLFGDHAKSKHVARQIMDSHVNGFWVVGASTQRPVGSKLVNGIEVVSDFEHVIEAVDELDVDTVIMTGSDSIAPENIREFGWQLEARHIDLIVAAALTDVAGPRIHTRPVSGLPLIHVEFPTFSGPKHFMKRMFDLLGSLILIVLGSPIMLVVAAAVKFTSKGPVIYKQERVGLNGRRFPMYKFRSMVADAEDRLPGLLDHSEGNGVLFKMKNDPRVTPVGRVLRKYSLDELPQLFNVFGGTMSLVGPRPPLPREVADYEDWVHRRLLVKPGITGLWQVSGRSNLSWEDSVRLDLYYVENWSIVGDLVLLWRTVKTVLKPEGAY